MTDINFYHLTARPLEWALPKLLEKSLQAEARVVVMASSEERVADLNAHLWAFDQDSWLPHGSEKDGNAELQPIWLTIADENPNEARFLFLTDGATSEPQRRSGESSTGPLEGLQGCRSYACLLAADRKRRLGEGRLSPVMDEISEPWSSR